MNILIKAIRESSISIACLLDEPSEVTQKDLKHIQDQITIIENYLEPFVVEELETIKQENRDV